MKVTILMPLYNGAEFLAQSVGSVLDQVHADWELLIGVNGHPAGSDVLRHARSFESGRIKVVDLGHLPGKAAALNALAAMAQSEAVALLDVDDRWRPRKLQRQVPRFQDEGYDVVGTLGEYFGDREGPIRVKAGRVEFADLLDTNHVINSSSLLRREDAWWDPDWEGAEDYELWLRLAHAERRFYNVGEPLVWHRLHRGSAFNTKTYDTGPLRERWREAPRTVSGSRPRILIGILHTPLHAARRENCLRTWLVHADRCGVDYVFLVGGASEFRRDGHVLHLPCPDNYASLPQKTRLFCQWALENAAFDYLFKCDVSLNSPMNTGIIGPALPNTTPATTPERHRWGDRVPKSARPQKPYPDFPLFANQNGQWAKKVRGRLHYFGPWSDPQAALNHWLDVRDDLYVGRTPGTRVPEELQLRHALNHFLNTKKARMEAGQLSPLSYARYLRVTNRMIEFFGRTKPIAAITAADLESFYAVLSKKYSVVSLGTVTADVRTILKHFHDAGLIPQPLRLGTFRGPGKRVLRRARAKRPERMFEAYQIRKLLEHARPQLRAMILLGVNCGLGPHDCALLEFKHIRLEQRLLDYPRPKTGAPRRAVLWPETVDVLRQWLQQRPSPATEEFAQLVFLTRNGKTWISGHSATQIGAEYRRLTQGLNLSTDFYRLRHVCQTIGDLSLDRTAVALVMGHLDGSMSDEYRERLENEPERLRRVADVIHDWLFGQPTKPKKGGSKAAPTKAKKGRSKTAKG